MCSGEHVQEDVRARNDIELQMAKNHQAPQQRAARLLESETSSSSTSQWGTSQTEVSCVMSIGTSIIHCTPKLFHTIHFRPDSAASGCQHDTCLSMCVPRPSIAVLSCSSFREGGPAQSESPRTCHGTISTTLLVLVRCRPQSLVFLLCPLRGCLMCRERHCAASAMRTVSCATYANNNTMLRCNSRRCWRECSHFCPWVSHRHTPASRTTCHLCQTSILIHSSSLIVNASTSKQLMSNSPTTTFDQLSASVV